MNSKGSSLSAPGNSAEEKKKETTMTVRAKMVCNTRTELSCKSSYGEVAMKVEFGAVWEGTAADGGPAAQENRIFGDATPSGSISMMICNPEAFDQFKAGETYYVDFTPTGKKVEYFNKGEKVA